MRKWHRWLSVFFGVFLLWIAVTGVLSQIVPIVERGGQSKEAAARAAQAVPPGFVCPETMQCRPKRPSGSIVGTLHHLHSGETFGPIGVAVSTLAGLAMIFFAVSGLWMYLQMWRSRKQRGLNARMLWE